MAPPTIHPRSIASSTWRRCRSCCRTHRNERENEMKTLRVLGLALLLASGVAFGHGNTKPLHGGVVQMVGEQTFELVAKPDGTELYVVDDGEDIDSSKSSATMIVDAGGTKSEVVMLAAGGNRY